MPGLHTKRIKSVSPSPNVVDKKALKRSEFKRSTMCVKAESNLASRTQTGIVGSNASGDEAALPVTQRRGRALVAMSDFDTLATDDKMETKSLVMKHDVPCSSNVRVPGSQLHKKRRAVCLFDEDDDEPKTPVHGGSVRNFKASLYVSDATKSTDANNESSNNAQQGVSTCLSAWEMSTKWAYLRRPKSGPSRLDSGPFVFVLPMRSQGKGVQLQCTVTRRLKHRNSISLSLHY